jgi:16S rRNA (guanine527-N7)-methyltransferase
MLKDIFLKADISLNDTQIKDLLKFKDLLIKYNKMFNLTSILQEEQIFIKHFLDSIYGAKYFDTDGKIIEIGSGGGFPSVPLKLYNKNLNFTLVESVGKKCNFLNVVKQEFNLDNFSVINDRCEVLAKKPEFREQFDFVTARAVAKINTLLEYTLPFLKVGGKFIAFKTSDAEELLLAKKVAPLLGGTLEETISYSLPNEQGERIIYIFKKIDKTDKKYPRGQGKERSHPLV